MPELKDPCCFRAFFPLFSFRCFVFFFPLYEFGVQREYCKSKSFYSLRQITEETELLVARFCINYFSNVFYIYQIYSSHNPFFLVGLERVCKTELPGFSNK